MCTYQIVTAVDRLPQLHDVLGMLHMAYGLLRHSLQLFYAAIFFDISLGIHAFTCRMHSCTHAVRYKFNNMGYFRPRYTAFCINPLTLNPQILSLLVLGVLKMNVVVDKW